MKRALLVFTLLAPAWAQELPALSGTVTDPSGAAVPGAAVQLRGPGRDRRVKTDRTGQYSFDSLAPGSYQVRFTAKGFAVSVKNDLVVDRPSVFDVQLVIGTSAQVINVEDQQRGVSAEADSNGSAIVMRERQIAALSDDPDELALQLQALAGPAPGPGGGQIFIDGFTGGNLPPSERSASTPTPSRRNTTGRAFRASRSLPSRAATRSTGRPSRNSATRSSIRAIRCSCNPRGRLTTRNSTV